MKVMEWKGKEILVIRLKFLAIFYVTLSYLKRSWKLNSSWALSKQMGQKKREKKKWWQKWITTMGGNNDKHRNSTYVRKRGRKEMMRGRDTYKTHKSFVSLLFTSPSLVWDVLHSKAALKLSSHQQFFADQSSEMIRTNNSKKKNLFYSIMVNIVLRKIVFCTSLKYFGFL